MFARKVTKVAQKAEFRLVLIEWLDSYGCSATWQDLANCELGVMVRQSVGWLIHDDERCKVIFPHMNQPDHTNASQPGCGDMTIPSASIIKILELG
jgi:hypothetical protein